MEKIIKIAQEHEEYTKIMSLIKKSLKTISNDEGLSLFEELKQFIDEYLVVHFEFEENEFFTTILMIGSAEEKQVIRELQQEHVRILDKVAQFNDLFFSDGYRSKDLLKIMETHRCSQEVISSVIQHARKEDKELIPVLKKYKNIF